jgi:urease beta subunit
MRNATVSDVEVDGFAGKLVTMSVPDDMDYDESKTSSDGFVDCDLGQFRTWNSPAGTDVRGQQGPGQRDDVYILDVNGTRVVVNVAYFPDLQQPQISELESIVQSMRIRSVYVIGPSGDFPGELTFTVPEGWEEVVGNDALISEMGGRDIYIMRWDITHVYADPCQWQGTLEEVGPTVDDLVAALEQQPMRDATVSDVELDGFAGKLVTMSVPDDMDYDASATSSNGFTDCDLGQFMTSNNPAGNAVRLQQGPGQRDDVYILDVNGTRVELDVAYYPDLPQADLDEIESIVQSVRIDPPEASETPATTGSQPGN